MLDTNVVVSGLLWRGQPNELLDLGSSKAIAFFSSPVLFAELAEVLSRPKLQPRILASGVSADDIVRAYADSVLSVRPAPVPRIAPDPDDDVVIGTAVAAHAELVVTGDRGLLSVAQYRDIRIITVEEALKSVRH